MKAATLGGRHVRITLTSSPPALQSNLMKTTLVIEDDVLKVARGLAEAEGKSLGEVISDLARRGLAPRSQEVADEGFPVFPLPPEAKPITLETVHRALDES
jgi:hypothetical protein